MLFSNLVRFTHHYSNNFSSVLKALTASRALKYFARVGEHAHLFSPCSPRVLGPLKCNILLVDSVYRFPGYPKPPMTVAGPVGFTSYQECVVICSCLVRSFGFCMFWMNDFKEISLPSQVHRVKELK